MITKLIVLGHTGMLGRYITSYFKNIEIFTPSYRISNNTKGSDIEAELLKCSIDSDTCVINCIGLIPQRNPDNIKMYYLVNSIFPHLLLEICRKYGAEMIQPTTDCVFSGIKGQYIETDTHDETNAYGMSKSIGEPPDCTVIRTSIIGEEVYNKRSFLEFVKTSKGQIYGWDNHLWNGITCLEYCKIIDTIISKDLFWKGVKHIFSPNPVTKYELACIIKDTYGLDVTILKTSTETCDKTLNSIYSNTFEISDIRQQIIELRKYNLDVNDP
jgi:dTDP-4-dehydrorhamnose reductase